MNARAAGPSLSIPRAILLGTLAVGVLDGGFVVIRVLMHGRSPVRPFQAIAAGLLGPAAYDGGLATALLGVGLHFLIALAVVALAVLVGRRAPWFVRHPILLGALYGVVVFAVMQFVVIPASALSAGPRDLARMVPMILIHVFGVGIPAALAARSTSLVPRAGTAGTPGSATG